MQRHFGYLALAVVSLLSLSSCPNIFDPLDSPSGDAQILAYARACFDKGDYACALEYYGKLANNESARADEAFVILDQNNLGVASFAQAMNIATGEAVGSILTTMAESAAPGAGVTKRVALTNAYKKVASISNTTIRGFVRFATAIAIASEILAEESGVQADRIVQQTDYMPAPVTNCDAATACGGGDNDCCNGGAGCGTSTIAAGADTYNMSTAPGSVDLSAATPTWGMVAAAIGAASLGLTEMGVSSGDSLALVTAITGQAAFANGTSGQCARGLLVRTLGFGR